MSTATSVGACYLLKLALSPLTTCRRPMMYGPQVEALVHGIESALKDEADQFYRVDVVPIGGGPAQ